MRLNYRRLLPDSLSAMVGLERAAKEGLPDARLLDLVRVGASQLNGCAFCLGCTTGRPGSRAKLTSVWT